MIKAGTTMTIPNSSDIMDKVKTNLYFRKKGPPFCSNVSLRINVIQYIFIFGIFLCTENIIEMRQYQNTISLEILSFEFVTGGFKLEQLKC